MMAKMFYTVDEAKVALGKNDEELKQLTREGKLREFRDGPRLMYKADQIDTLKADASGVKRDQVDLGPSDSGSPIGLVDSKGASGTSITLSDDDISASGKKHDTGLAADLGLSGSVGGMPSPSRAGPISGSGLSGSAGSRGGINVFGADEVEHADPMAQTAITPGVRDQINLEGVGSGSGLLDLTRESDDTSLGAELLDEITPGAGKGKGPSTPRSGGGPLEELGEGPIINRGGMPIYVEAADPAAPAFGAAALAATIAVLFGGFVLVSAMLGTRPEMIKSLADSGKGLWFMAIIGLVVVVVFFVIGLFIGKAAKRA